MPLWRQFDRGKSISRYVPAKGRAGLARSSVRGPRRLPSPPASTSARTLGRFISRPPDRRGQHRRRETDCSGHVVRSYSRSQCLLHRTALPPTSRRLAWHGAQQPTETFARPCRSENALGGSPPGLPPSSVLQAVVVSVAVVAAALRQ